MVNFPQVKQPKKGAFKVKRSHGYTALLFLLGTLFPPLAVAARFGIGSDFFINLVLTLSGYIPGHVHNFYIQNIRNNKNNRRTPKWAIRYGLIDDGFLKKKKKKSQWANRYEERLPNSAYEGQELEEGQERTDADSVRSAEVAQGPTLWREEEESFYSTGSGGSTEDAGRWHYPANFEESEVIPDVSRKRKSKSGKKKSSSSKSRSSGTGDRWERSEEAYAAAAATPSKKKRSSTRRTRSDDSLGADDAAGGSYGAGRTEDSGSGAGWGEERRENGYNGYTSGPGAVRSEIGEDEEGLNHVF